jgi:6-pyruvoyltetrahydropterin/6-carboxytetrahydropterin synthase
MELRKTFQFEAAHLLPRLPKTHKCRRLHGHSFKVEIAVAGKGDPKLGWLMDYADITQAFKPIWARLDHNYLNQIRGLENPTSENIACWIWRKLKPKLPLLVEVVVAETCNARCIYRGTDYLTPPPLTPAQVEAIYGQPDKQSDTVGHAAWKALRAAARMGAKP